MRNLVTIMLIGFALLYALWSLDIPFIAKIVITIGSLFLVSKHLEKKYGFENQSGILLVKTTRFTKIYDSVAKKYKEIFNRICDFWLAVSYGLFGFLGLDHYKLLKRSLMVITGIAVFFFLMIFIYPNAVLILMNSMNGFSKMVEAQIDNEHETGFFNNLRYAVNNIAYNVSLISGFIGGFSLTSVVSLIISSIRNILVVLSTLFETTNQKPSSGMTLIIPGFNLPLLEGIISLFIVLAVHESAHAILSRIAKIKLNSMGIALFGIVPVGAFVEPDEEKIKKKPRIEQIRIMIAGVVSNFIFGLLFFIMLSLFTSLTYDFRQDGVKVIASSIIPKGEMIQSIGGYDIKTIDDINLLTNDTYTLKTNKGEYLVEVSDHKIKNTYVKQIYKDGRKWRVYYKKGFEFMQIIFNTLALAFSLNIVVGTVNLLPLPLFDGYRILELLLKDKKKADVIMYVTLVAIGINFLTSLI